MQTKYTVHDTFNDKLIRTHRTLEGAAKSQRRFLRAVQRSNGPSSYLPTSIRKDGQKLTEAEHDQLVEVYMKLDARG